MKTVATSCFILWIVIMTSGCAQMHTSSSFAQKDAVEPGQNATTSQAPTMQYQFPDLPVPVELTRDSDKTLIIKTPHYHGGILFYKGRIKGGSLEAFFMENLPKHGWIFQGSIHGKTIFLAFSKELGGQCLVKIDNQTFNTTVEIWLSEPLGSIQ